MTGIDPSAHPVPQLASAAFADLIEQGAIDIVEGERQDDVEIQANQWTVAMQGWPLTSAFLAVDDEPTSDDEMGNAITTIVGPGDLAALRTINRQLDGQLGHALRQSMDPLSVRLAAVLGHDEAEGSMR